MPDHKPFQILLVEDSPTAAELAGYWLRLCELFEGCDELIAPDLDRQFITTFFGLLQPETRTLRYASAAHSSLLLRADGSLQELDSRTTPWAVHSGPAEVSDEITLAAGDLLVLYTDGQVERCNPRNEMFGAARLVDTLREARQRTATEILESVFGAVRDSADGLAQNDDETLVIVKVVP